MKRSSNFSFFNVEKSSRKKQILVITSVSNWLTSGLYWLLFWLGKIKQGIAVSIFWDVKNACCQVCLITTLTFHSPTYIPTGSRIEYVLTNEMKLDFAKKKGNSKKSTTLDANKSPLFCPQIPNCWSWFHIRSQCFAFSSEVSNLAMMEVFFLSNIGNVSSEKTPTSLCLRYLNFLICCELSELNTSACFPALCSGMFSFKFSEKNECKT